MFLINIDKGTAAKYKPYFKAKDKVMEFT